MTAFLLVLIGLASFTQAQTVITPGTGFSGATAEPGATGSPGDPGYDATVIARWDVVPWQSFSDSIGIGIVAFHINGIEKVAFSAEGGGWTDITRMTLNPRTRVWEYWGMLRAADFTREGKIEIRAVVYPKTAGHPRILADSSSTHRDLGDGSLYLLADRGGLSHPVVWVDDNGNDASGTGTEANPYQTIDRAIEAKFPSSVAAWEEDQTGILDGAVIYLKAGTYLAPTQGYYKMGRWVTVAAAPGLSQDQVTITGNAGGRCNIQLLKFDNLTWQPSSNSTIVSPSRPDRYAWFHRIKGVGADRQTYGDPWVNQGHTFYTSTTLYNFTQGVQTWNGSTWLARDVAVTHIVEDAFRMNTLMVNCSVDDVDATGTTAHPDIIQAGCGTNHNFIVYNLKVTNVKSQGIYMCGSGWALVNVFIEQEGSGLLWQIDNNYVDHGLLWHCGTVGQSLVWRPGDFTSQCKNISIRNCAWQAMDCGASSKGGATDCSFLGTTAMSIDNNHFISSPFNSGTNATIGALTFTDQAGDDFHPAAGSPLVNRVTDLIVPCDVENEARGDTTAVGAFRYSDETSTGSIDGKQLTMDKKQNPFIWPNPVTNLMNIQLPTSNVQCSIFDIQGNPVLNRARPEPGVYYIRYGAAVHRVIVIR